MEKKDGAGTPQTGQWIGDVQWQEFLATALREDDTPVAAIPIHTKKNVDGQPENFHHQALQSLEGAAGSSARGSTCLSPNKTDMFFLTRTRTYMYACYQGKS